MKREARAGCFYESGMDESAASAATSDATEETRAIIPAREKQSEKKFYHSAYAS